jgi:hypothetical protein
MEEVRPFERLVLDRFEFRGFHGCRSCCRLEIVPLRDGRTLVVATELPDNPGTSVTNAAEILAADACRRFRIDPRRLVWVEHYGYPVPGDPAEPRGFDRVAFRIGPGGEIGGPSWRPMTGDDWRGLGCDPRPAVRYGP